MIRTPDPLGRGPASGFPAYGRTEGPIIDDMRDVAWQRGRIDGVMAATIGLLLCFLAFTLSDPHRLFLAVDTGVDIAVTSFSVLVAFLMAVMTFLRYRIDGSFTRFIQVLATSVVAAFLAAMAAILVTRAEAVIRLSLFEPGQTAAWLSLLCRSVVAVLMAWAAIAALRGRVRIVRHPVSIILASLALLGLGCGAIVALGDALPIYLEPSAIARLQSFAAMPSIPHGLTHGGFPGVTPLASLLSLTPALLAAFGAVTFWVAARRGGAISHGFLAVGLAVACVAELLNAIVPSVYAGFVTPSDVLRLIFFSVFLVGVLAEERADLAMLRSVVDEQERIVALEADRMVLEERARLARELHDGLSQHLFFAKLKLERLAPMVGGDAAALATEASGAIDTAIGEAREALVTLRDGHVPGLSLAELLEQSGRQVAGRAGIDVRVQAAPDLPERLDAGRQAELLRIVREALTNVVRHADATVVRIRAERDGHDLLVAIADNGRGFDTTREGREGMGRLGMEERARLLGGRLTVDSEPRGGTTVTLRVADAEGAR